MQLLRVIPAALFLAPALCLPKPSPDGAASTCGDAKTFIFSGVEYFAADHSISRPDRLLTYANITFDFTNPVLEETLTCTGRSNLGPPSHFSSEQSFSCNNVGKTEGATFKVYENKTIELSSVWWCNGLSVLNMKFANLNLQPYCQPSNDGTFIGTLCKVPGPLEIPTRYLFGKK